MHTTIVTHSITNENIVNAFSKLHPKFNDQIKGITSAHNDTINISKVSQASKDI